MADGSAAEVYRAYNDAENSHDLTATRRLIADDLYVEINGRAELGSAEEDDVANAELLRCYPDYRREVVDVVSAGDRAAVRWRMIGTSAPDSGLDPLDVHGCSVIEVAGNRITKAFLYVDGGVLDALLERSRTGARS